MKKALKRLMLLVLVALILPLQHFVVFAGTNGTSGLYKYTLYTGTSGSGITTNWIEITGHTQYISGELIIPDTINGYPVEQIGDNAFSNQGGISTLSIPAGVSTIGVHAFSNCSNLTKVVIRDGESNSFVDIKKSAFMGCYELQSITLALKKGYTIRDMAFASCSALTDIYYRGTKENYDACSISVYDYNEDFINAELFYIDSVRNISLNKSSTSIIKNNSETLIPTITPSDATNKTIIWSSSNTSVATVSSTGVVKGVGVGTATITAITEDKNRTATCLVYVSENVDEDTLGSGDGTALNPYKIDCEEKLQIVSDIPNAHYILVADIKLTGDFTPICSLNDEFSGVFDGNGHTISNVTISSYYENSGLFGKNSGTIKNLKVIYSSTGSKYNYSKSTNFGGIAGSNNGNVINCTVDLTANITGTTSSDYTTTIGGIVGRNSTNGIIQNCGVDGKIVVNATSSSNDSKSIYIGGVSGISLNSISDCDVEICITQDIVIDGYVSVDSFIGGVSASGSGTIKNTKAIYDITTGTASLAHIGGVIGTANNFTIEKVFADGKIRSTANSVYAGGIIGNDLSSKKSSITKAKVNLTADISDIVSATFVGGISGYLKTSSSITESWATIDFNVTKSTSYVAVPSLHCGGLTGTTSGQINNSCAIGSIASNLVVSSVYSGGLVGGISGANPTINNSYASVSGVKYGLSYPGGTVNNSFYDRTISGCSDTGYGTPTATVSMKMKSIYSNAGWDFNNIWDLSSSINSGYPHLRELVNSLVINVTSMSIDKSNLTMSAGESQAITATVSPSNATNKNVIWSSSNTKVATVSNGIVTAVSSGSAIITAKSEDGSYTDTCSVIVKTPTLQKVSTPTSSIISGNIAKGTTITLSTETEGATIYYTTDGSTPNTTSLIYTKAITINNNTTLKAYATKEGMADSTVATFAYSIIEDNKPTISISDKKGKPGDTITLSLNISNNLGIAGMILKLSYDEGLTLTSITTGSALSGLTFTPPANVSKNPCTLLWDGITADNTNGTILSLSFKINDTAPEGEYSVKLSYTDGDIYDGNTQDINVQITNGVVTVCKYKTGDVNEDDIINAKDITLLRQFISGDYGVAINEDAADVNKDGTLNAKDITILRKYISGDYGIVLD